MTKEEALLFKARWRLANQRIAEEIRSVEALTKLRQLAAIFAAGKSLGWSERLRSGEEEVRERWRQLREKLNAGTQTL
jgi:hypothetical protein